MAATPNPFQKRNAEAKKWDLIKKRTAAKRLRNGEQPSVKDDDKPKKKQRSNPNAVYPGDTFDKLIVIEQRPAVKGYATALFKCVGKADDCLKEVVIRIAQARHNLKSGWCSCSRCYFKEGGIEIWKQKRAPVIMQRASQEAPFDVDKLVEDVVVFVAGRHKGVKVTTLIELQEHFKLPREMLITALLRALKEGRLERKRTSYGIGYRIVLDGDGDV